jgi:glycosyltransferase involved in cell wall biosynthesis
MRILIASGIFHPEPGGPATYLYRLLPELQAAGHHVTALAFGDAPVEGYPYPLTRVPRRNYLRRRWDYYRAAEQLWPGHDLAYIHSLGLPLPSTIRPRIAKIVGDPAWERAVNKGWVGADTDVDRFQTARFGPTVEVNKALRAREARRLDHVIVPGEYLRRMVLGWGVEPGRVSVIYNALEPPSDALPETQADARAALGLPGGPLLLTAARLTPWKGIDHTLRALARVRGMRLLVAGEGAMRPALEVLAGQLGVGERVTFLGRVPHEELWRYFRAADYTLLYSGYEGLPHVLLESLSAGTPIIAGDKGGSPEVVEHGVNGLLVPHVDVEALAEAIEAAFAPGRRAALAANTAVGLERFSPARMVEQTLAVLARFA